MTASPFEHPPADLKAITELRRWTKNEPLDHRKLNAPVNAINRMVAGVGPARQVRPRVTPESEGGEPVPARLLTHHGDYVIVERLGIDNELVGDPIAVAKPWTLRYSPFDNLTIEGISYNYASPMAQMRFASDGVTTERQFITSQYYAGVVLNIQKVGNRVLGVATESGGDIFHIIVSETRDWAWDGLAEGQS